MFVIEDGTGAAHYWSRYHQAMVVVTADGEVSYDLAFPVRTEDGTPIHTPSDWLEVVRERAGVRSQRISQTVVDDLARVVQ